MCEIDSRKRIDIRGIYSGKSHRGNEIKQNGIRQNGQKIAKIQSNQFWSIIQIPPMNEHQGKHLIGKEKEISIKWKRSSPSKNITPTFQKYGRHIPKDDGVKGYKVFYFTEAIDFFHGQVAQVITDSKGLW